jgi:hypothetical protein
LTRRRRGRSRLRPVARAAREAAEAPAARINVRPFAELLIRDAGGVVARDFTPAGFKRLDLGAGDVTVELCWPSVKDPQLRWSGRLDGLRSGQLIVISGDLKDSKIVVVRK